MTFETIKDHICFPMILASINNEKEKFHIKQDMIVNQGLVEALKCQTCSNILRRPTKCKHCESIFCEMCFKNNKRYDMGLCPNIKCKNALSSDGVINRRVANELENLKIKCNKCEEVVPYKKWDEHTLRCNWCIFCETDTKGTTVEEHKKNCKYSCFLKRCHNCQDLVKFNKTEEFG